MTADAANGGGGPIPAVLRFRHDRLVAAVPAEFIRFGMLDRAAENLAACEAAPESERLVATGARVERALAAARTRAGRPGGN